MAQFDDREKAQEAKFAHDGELRFKAEARRNKLLGQWVAGLMGLSGEAATAYAADVVAADFQEAGEEDVFRKIRADFDAKKIAQTDHQIRRTMDEFRALAVEQLRGEAR